jgi:phosphoribosylanthranilate isomerase
MKVIKVGAPADSRARHRRLCRRRRPADVRAADGILPGGNAKAFDWTFLSGRAVPLPWLLAGGLTPDNVAEAVRVTRRAAGRTFLLASKSSRGVKSVDLIRAFLERVKGIP